jgi:hypothetical protein
MRADDPIVFVIDDDTGVRVSIQGLLNQWACVVKPSEQPLSSCALGG